MRRCNDNTKDEDNVGSRMKFECVWNTISVAHLMGALRQAEKKPGIPDDYSIMQSCLTQVKNQANDIG